MTLTFEDRARGAILGQFVGDALALGSHWHYNLRERARLYPGGIQGFEAPAVDHYHKTRKPGEPCHYGDAALVQFESLVAVGQFDARDFGRRFVAFFSNPAYVGYLDKPTRLTMQAFKDAVEPDNYAFDAGPDDFQTVTMCRLAPVVVDYAGKPALSSVIAEAVRVNQNNPQAIAHNQVYATILEAILLGGSVQDAIQQAVKNYVGPYSEKIAERLDDALAMQDETVVNATGLVGRSCYLPCTFPAILHAALRHADDFDTGVLETVRAGGDNASRAAVVGAWLGAAHGVHAIPQVWRERMGHLAKVEALSEQLLAAHHS